MSAFSGASSRTLEISSPAIPVVLGRPALEPVRLSGGEGVNSLFEYIGAASPAVVPLARAVQNQSFGARP